MPGEESKAPEEAERAAGPVEEVAGLEPGPELALGCVVVAAIHRRRATRPESTTVVEG